MSVSDDFNRADGSLGSNWTTILNTPRIVSNQYAGPSFNDGAAIYAGTFPDDQYSQCTVKVDATSSDKGGPMVRGASGGNGYILRIATDGGSAQIHKMSSGTPSSLATITATWGDGDTAKLVATGTTLEAFQNGVSRGSVTDSTYSSGAPGLYLNNGFDNKGKLDNFQGSDVSGGTPADGSGTADGSAVATGVGRSRVESVASSAGVAAATAGGRSRFEGIAASAGLAAAIAGSRARWDVTGSSSGVATADGSAQSHVLASAGAAGLSPTIGDGQSRVEASASAAGSAGGSGQGQSQMTGSAAGTSTGTGAGQSRVEASGTAEGAATASGRGRDGNAGSGGATGMMLVGVGR